MKDHLPHQGERFTLVRISHYTSHLSHYSSSLFQQWKHRKVNPERTNPVWEENEKEKEDTMQVTGLSPNPF